MSNQDIKAGDVVQLKSGGPLMTVQVVDNASVRCIWFDHGQNVRFDEFAVDVLIISRQ